MESVEYYLTETILNGNSFLRGLIADETLSSHYSSRCEWVMPIRSASQSPISLLIESRSAVWRHQLYFFGSSKDRQAQIISFDADVGVVRSPLSPEASHFSCPLCSYLSLYYLFHSTVPVLIYDRCELVNN